jgi:5-formyltetrahydrofolate cyclo-ligase
MAETGKAALRQEARRRRRALQAASPKAAEAAAGLLPERLLDTAVVALYWPAGSEIDPRPLGDRLAACGAQLCLPAVAAPDAPLEFRAWRVGEPLSGDAIGMAAPGPEQPRLRPGMVIVPLLAFDRFGGRLGQGGGYYDRTLAQLRADGPVFVMGLAYAGQEAERLPAETHDQPLDAVLTETGFRAFRSNEDD